MDDATSCQWVIVCDQNVHGYKKFNALGHFLTITQMHSPQHRFFFLTCQQIVPKPTEKQHRRHFVVRNDDKVLADVREKERRTRSVNATKKRQVAATGSRDGTAASRVAPAHPTQRKVTSTRVDMSDRQPRSTPKKTS